MDKVESETSINVKDSDPEPDRVGSASFCRIRIEIGIQGKPIRIDIDSKQTKKFINFFLENFNMLAKIVKIVTHLTLIRKTKHCKLAML
jgi:hypothetical protein